MRAHEVERSGRFGAQFRDETFDGPGKQALPPADGKQVVVGGHGGGRVEIARSTVEHAIDEHQPPEAPLARTPQRSHPRNLQLPREGPLDADHAVAGDQRPELRGLTPGVEHDDHFVAGVFGRKQVFKLRGVGHAAAKDRDADAVGSVAVHGARSGDQQTPVPRPQDGQQQCTGAPRRDDEKQKQKKFHARERL